MGLTPPTDTGCTLLPPPLRTSHAHTHTHAHKFVPHKHFSFSISPARRTRSWVPAKNILTLINNIWHRCHGCTCSRGGPAHYFILVISFHFFYPSPFLSLLDSLLNLLDMLSSPRVRDARFELALNAINFPLVRHFCLILNAPSSLGSGAKRNLIVDIHVVIVNDIHTLLCSNLFALSDSPNIVTPDTTHRAPYCDQLLYLPPRRALTKKSH